MNRIYRIDGAALAAILLILSIPVGFFSTGSMHSNLEAYKLPVTAITMGDLNTGEIRNCALLLRPNRNRLLRCLNGVRFDNSFGSSDAESLNCKAGKSPTLSRRGMPFAPPSAQGMVRSDGER